MSIHELATSDLQLDEIFMAMSKPHESFIDADN